MRAHRVFERKDADAIDAADAGAAQHAAAETGGAESAAKQGQAKRQAQTTASAAGPEPVETQEAARMELEQDEQPASVEPRVAVAAQPHKRRAVSAATAVGAVGEGARQLGGATEATDDAPARHGGRVERRAACGARRRLAPYARGRAAA